MESSRTGKNDLLFDIFVLIFPKGKIMDSKTLGLVIKNQRKSLGLTQTEVALSCGVGIRFISDLENGKPSCQIGKALLVMESIGLKLMSDGK